MWLQSPCIIVWYRRTYSLTGGLLFKYCITIVHYEMHFVEKLTENTYIIYFYYILDKPPPGDDPAGGPPTKEPPVTDAPVTDVPVSGASNDDPFAGEAQASDSVR
jgi:hypothetical protein